MTTHPHLPARKNTWDILAVCFASCFFLSYLPSKLILSFRLKFRRKTLEERKWTGAGMVGALAGIGTFLSLPVSLAESVYVIGVGVLLSVVISDRAERVLRSHDDSRIVIDEWIGAWIAVWGFHDAGPAALLIGLFLFRVFDVFKGPWGHRLQKLPGGFGVVMDDLVAGLIANFCTRVLLRVLF